MIYLFFMYIFSVQAKKSQKLRSVNVNHIQVHSARGFIQTVKKKTILRKCFMYCRSFLFILLLFVVIFTLLELKSIKFCSPLLGECFVRQTMGEQISKNQQLFGQPIEPI